jgi:hypothetical protein
MYAYACYISSKSEGISLREHVMYRSRLESCCSFIELANVYLVLGEAMEMLQTLLEDTWYTEKFLIG